MHTFYHLKLKEVLNPPRERSPVNLDWYYENINPLVNKEIRGDNQEQERCSRAHHIAFKFWNDFLCRVLLRLCYIEAMFAQSIYHPAPNEFLLTLFDDYMQLSRTLF